MGKGRGWPLLKLTTPQETGGRGHPSLLKSPNWGPYEILIWLPSGDSRPTTDLLCDLGQVIPLLCASLSLSIKRWCWTSWNLGSLQSVALWGSRGFGPRKRTDLWCYQQCEIEEGRKKVSLTKPTFDRVNISVSLSGGGWKNLSPRIRSWPGKGFSGMSFPALRWPPSQDKRHL